MLSEAHRRVRRGQDVVVGCIETHGRAGTQELLQGLSIIPMRRVEYRGAVFEEMDTEAILARRPEVVLVDELAHTNVPGSARSKRWEDVELLCENGIQVLSTMNVQHLESLNDTIFEITGIRVREVVPDRLLQSAETVMVDITPRSLLHRLERGDIYHPDKVDSALRNWFREGNLSALREIALREVAHEVEADIDAYRLRKRIGDTWATHDRIMVCISPSRPSMRLIRRGWRMAQRLHAEITAVYVEDRPPTPARKRVLENDFALAHRLGVRVVTVYGNVADELIRFAREKQITQIVMGHSGRSRLTEFLQGSIIDQITRQLRTVDVLLVAPAADEIPIS
jgi:two-component system sensor histidine kinase KdpD